MHKITQDLGVEFYKIEHIPITLSAVHPNYKAVTQNSDFWMIRLQWASKLYSGNVVPLDTPTDTLVLSRTSGADLVTFGFDKLAFGGVTPNVMQEVVVDYISNAACVSQPYGYSSSQITPNIMYAGRSGKDSCQGNSGGPILDANTGKQVGVVSWGIGWADPLFPGVYSRINAAYNTFIGPFIANWSNPTTSPPNLYAWTISSTTTEHIPGCTDLGGFYDSNGVDFNCMWYAGSENGATRFSLYGNNFAHAGLMANMACCVCGGGEKSPMSSTSTTQKPTSKPSTCKPTTMASSMPTTGKPTAATLAKPPAHKPTSTPNQVPTSKPTTPPTSTPTQMPTNKPTTLPTSTPPQMPTNEPTTDSPTMDSLTTGSPTSSSPTTDSPTTDSPTTDSPTMDSPTTKPTTLKPTTHKPTKGKPISRKPTTGKPIL